MLQSGNIQLDLCSKLQGAQFAGNFNLRDLQKLSVAPEEERETSLSHQSRSRTVMSPSFTSSISFVDRIPKRFTNLPFEMDLT